MNWNKDNRSDVAMRRAERSDVAISHNDRNDAAIGQADRSDASIRRADRSDGNVSSGSWNTRSPNLICLAGEGYVWAAGEAAAMRAIHADLTYHRRFPKSRIRAAAYWKKGSADAHEDIG
jgi:NADPH-dependent ferric siderophore reductase